MDYIEIVSRGGDTVLRGVQNFDIDVILDCGQSFRWEKLRTQTWRGIAFGRCRTVMQDGDTVVFCGVDEREFQDYWHDYFDFGRDYVEVKKLLSQDVAMRRAVEFSPGMRVLRQEPWETLCTFILSQNNNIKRIQGLVYRLCESFGEKIEGGFAFPAAGRLAALEAEDLAPVRCGFRAKYIIDAARKVHTGEVDLSALYTGPDAAACEALQKICGVGPKVARCTLLFGFGRAGCVPVDVWIGRALQEFYPDGLPPQLKEIAGLGQQYLFHYMRHRSTADMA